MKRIGIFTSGGDSPGMNAAVRAAVRTALNKDIEVYGVYRGYEGMIRNEIAPLSSHDVSHIIQKGGTILRSARSPEFMTKEGRKQAFENLMTNGIEGLVAIGGDGTFAGARIFGREFDFPIVGLAGTIDNDLYGTDFTIGYDTAINTAMHAIDKIKDTANAHDRLFFVEVMGRDAGFIALRTGLATGAEAVLIPERKTAIDRLIDTLRQNYRTKKTSTIVVVAEGDDAGGAFDVAKKVKERFDEYEIRVSILGHIQRGGSPTCMDRVRASQLGAEAVRSLMAGRRGIMIGIVDKRFQYTPFEKAIKHHQDINPLMLELVEILS